MSGDGSGTFLSQVWEVVPIMSYEELQENLRGVAFTTPTPFSDDGSSVRIDELNQIVQSITEAGGKMLIPCGNTGEYYSLTNDERATVVGATVDSTDRGVSVVGGVGGSTKTAKTLLDDYEKAGADGAMIMQPNHTYVHADGLEHYYRGLIESTSLGVVLYKRGPYLSNELVETLAEYENTIGVKYAVNDIKGFSNAVESVNADIVWSNGIAERFAPAFALEGAEGFTTGIGNFLPEEVLGLMTALREEDWSRAIEIRNVLRPYEEFREESGANNSFASANNVPGVKHGMELAGLYGGPVREPIVDLTPSEKQRAERIYTKIKDAAIFE